MNDPITVLCPGQGAQAVGMGKAWYNASPEAKGIFDQAEKVLGSRLGIGLRDLCFDGPAERLNQTDASQPAIYVTSIACWRGLMAKWGKGEGEVNLAAAAGLSLGEYTALHLAGAISFAEGLELVALRGRAMQDAAEASPGGMVALIGPDDAQAADIADAARDNDVLVCANFNAPGQVVLSGHKTACERAAKVAVDRGFRATMLQVAGAFHSPLMQPAAERLQAALKTTTLKQPRSTVVANVTARPHAPAEEGWAASITRTLVEQLTQSVRWAESCAWINTNVKATPKELAPGVTLAGLMRRIDRSVKVQSHDTPE